MLPAITMSGFFKLIAILGSQGWNPTVVWAGPIRTFKGIESFGADCAIIDADKKREKIEIELRRDVLLEAVIIGSNYLLETNTSRSSMSSSISL